MADLEIAAGYGSFDPITQILDYDAHGAGGDSNIHARCGKVYAEALNLICRIGNPADAEVFDDYARLTTPPVRYRTIRGNVGFVWLYAGLEQSVERPPVAFDSGNSAIFLDMADTPQSVTTPVMVLLPDSIEYATGDFFRPGGNADLNFFWGVVEKMRSAAFPKDKKLEEEQKRDLLADILRAQREAA